jgi:hypothetical protein
MNTNQKGTRKDKEARYFQPVIDLDTTRELPIKKPLSAYVHFLNEVSIMC